MSGRTMTITEVSRQYELSQDTLRYYERIGLLPRVKRTAGGIRSYSEEDCRWVEFIRCMRSAGMSIEALREYVSLFNQGSATIAERKKLLSDQREKIIARIKDLNGVLEQLNWKLDNYEEQILSYEKDLKRHK